MMMLRARAPGACDEPPGRRTCGGVIIEGGQRKSRRRRDRSHCRRAPSRANQTESPSPSSPAPSNARSRRASATCGSGARCPVPRAALLRALLLCAQGREGTDRGGDLAYRLGPPQGQARGGHGGRRPGSRHELSRLLEVPDRDRDARARRPRRADGHARGAPAQARRRGPVRGGQEKPLPFLPKVVGIVTSPTGAVIRDMLHGFEERFPTRVLVWPVRVQGGPAPPRSRPPSAASTRSRRGPVQRPDVLIGARRWQPRGPLGPSDEAVVRAPRRVPSRSFPRLGTRRTGRCWTTPPTRAPTPTKAAEWAVPIFADLAEDLAKLGLRLSIGLRRLVQGAGAHLKAAARGSDWRTCSRCRASASMLPDRLERCFLASLQKRHTRLAQLRGRLPAAASLVRLPRQRFEASRRLGRALLANAGCRTPPCAGGRAHAACRAPGAGALPGAARRTRAPCRARWRRDRAGARPARGAIAAVDLAQLPERPAARLRHCSQCCRRHGAIGRAGRGARAARARARRRPRSGRGAGPGGGWGTADARPAEGRAEAKRTRAARGPAKSGSSGQGSLF